MDWLPLEFKEFGNIVKKVFTPDGRYTDKSRIPACRLELTKDGQSVTFFFDVPSDALIEEPKYYRSCSISLKQRDASGIVWRVNVIPDYSDIVYEFRESPDGKVDDGKEIWRVDTPKTEMES